MCLSLSSVLMARCTGVDLLWVKELSSWQWHDNARCRPVSLISGDGQAFFVGNLPSVLLRHRAPSDAQTRPLLLQSEQPINDMLGILRLRWST